MTRPKKKSSTSAEAEILDLHQLGYGHLGQEISVVGRDVTFGLLNAPRVTHTGVVESLHMNAQRVRIVLLTRPGNRQFKTPRIVEVRE